MFAIAEEAASLVEGLGDLSLLSQAAAAEEVPPGLSTSSGELIDPKRMYWDDQCTARPARLYDHCWAHGGELVDTRPCCKYGSCAYVEGLCKVDVPGALHNNTGRNIRKLYHETNAEIAELILKNGFRPGRTGWCGGAIYFFGEPIIPETKFAKTSHRGVVLEAVVDLGRLAHLDKTCHDAYIAKKTYDSLTFDPFDGPEYIVFGAERILMTRVYSGM